MRACKLAVEAAAAEAAAVAAAASEAAESQSTSRPGGLDDQSSNVSASQMDQLRATSSSFNGVSSRRMPYTEKSRTSTTGTLRPSSGTVKRADVSTASHRRSVANVCSAAHTNNKSRLTTSVVDMRTSRPCRPVSSSTVFKPSSHRDDMADSLDARRSLDLSEHHHHGGGAGASYSLCRSVHCDVPHAYDEHDDEDSFSATAATDPSSFASQRTSRVYPDRKSTSTRNLSKFKS